MKSVKRAVALCALCFLFSICIPGVFAEITPHITDDETANDFSDDAYSEEPYEDDTSGDDIYGGGDTGMEESTFSSQEEESSGESESSAAATPRPAASPVPAALGTDNTSGGDVDEEYVVIGKIQNTVNEVGSSATLLGVGMIALGAVGIVCVFVWSWASRKTKKTPDEEVYEAVGMADARNRAESRPAQYQGARNPAAVPRNEVSEQRQAPVPRRETPILPQDSRGPAPQQRQAAPRPAKPAVPASGQQRNPAQRQAAAANRQGEGVAQRPANTKPQRRGGYDTDEIIREALGRKDG